MKNNKINILAVDDRRDNLLLLERCLMSSEVNVIKAESGRQALDLISDYSFALILMDVLMPEMDGFETAELIRKNNMDKEIPIIFITAINKEDKYIFEGYKLGAVDYITKPFNLTILKNKVDVFIRLFDQKQKLEVLNIELEERVQLRTRELTIAKEKAEEANIAKSRFLSNMSHELLTPLHGAQSYTQFGIKETLEKDDKKLHTYFTRIDVSCQRLRLLLDDLLNLSRFQAGLVSYKMDTYNIKYIVMTVCDSLTQEVNKKSIIIEVEETSGELIAWGDMDKLSLLFWHLISNAIKFSENEKTIKIFFSRESFQIGNDTIETIKVAIENRGVGVPENELEYIFEDFSESSKTASNAGGKGLGLSLCREIVKTHHGKIWVENIPQGVVFNVLIPTKAVISPSE